MHSASAAAGFPDYAGSGGDSAGGGGGGGVAHGSSFTSLQQQPSTASSTSNKRKKSPWYNALYPSYKSRSEDFKKIFTKLPEGERLIVGEFDNEFGVKIEKWHHLRQEHYNSYPSIGVGQRKQTPLFYPLFLNNASNR